MSNNICNFKVEKEDKTCNKKCIDNNKFCYLHNYLNEIEYNGEKLISCLFKSKHCYKADIINEGQICRWCVLKRCIAIENDGTQCSNYKKDNSNLCGKHKNKKVTVITEITVDTVKCVGCHNLFEDDNNYKTCIKCRNRGKANREKDKLNKINEPKIELPKCKAIIKKSRCCSDATNNDLCEKHQEYEEGNHCLSKYVTECKYKMKTLPPDITTSSCPECLERDNKAEKSRKNKLLEQNKILRENGINERICLECKKQFKNFLTKLNVNSFYCLECYNIRSINNKNRIRERPDYSLYERREDVKAKRKLWKMNHKEKILNYSRKYRRLQYQNNKVNYLKRNNENMKIWRTNNYIHYINYLRKYNRRDYVMFEKYKYRAVNVIKISFELTFKQFKEIINKECNYCGHYDVDRLNSVDRIDNNDGYFIENCTAACTMCNMMKKDLPDDIFMKRIFHIAKFNNLINDVNSKFFDDAFYNYSRNNINYDNYKTTSINIRKRVFELTDAQYNDLIKKDCYLCGKKSI